ncbi:MAG TPA: hypothetical protein VMW31_04415, partial [Devosiaceae bacterium]|nr:hypothetical protein [Devosiaceae bacterium]
MNRLLLIVAGAVAVAVAAFAAIVIGTGGQRPAPPLAELGRPLEVQTDPSAAATAQARRTAARFEQ